MKVPIDDITRALYKRESLGRESIYVKEYPLGYSLSKEKVLYIFVQDHVGHQQSMIFMDKYGQEWNFLNFNYMGKSVTRDTASTFENVFYRRTSGTKYPN